MLNLARPHIQQNERETPMESVVGLMAFARLVHQGEQIRQETEADLGDAAQTRLDDVGAPGRVTVQEMGVKIDECAVRAGELGNHGIDPAVVLASEGRIDACEVAGVVTEGRIVDVAQEHWPHREIAQERVEGGGEGRDARAAIDEQPPQQVIAADRQDRGSFLTRRQVPRLCREGVDRGAVDRPMLESDCTACGEVLTPKFREEHVVVADKELSRIQTAVVVPPGVEDRIAKGVEREGHTLVVMTHGGGGPSAAEAAGVATGALSSLTATNQSSA